jgi:hypothetical protein
MWAEPLDVEMDAPDREQFVNDLLSLVACHAAVLAAELPPLPARAAHLAVFQPARSKRARMPSMARAWDSQEAGP